MKQWAASKYYLRVCQRDSVSVGADGFTYHGSEDEAVNALVGRERAAIEKLEQDARRARKRLVALMKKCGKVT